MSGAYRTLVDNTKLEKNCCCGVCNWAFWAVKLLQMIPITKNTNNKIYQWCNMARKECLEPAGHWLMTQHSKRILAVVYKKGILGGKDAT